MRLLRLVILSLIAVPVPSRAQAPRVQEYWVDAGHSIVEFSIGFAFSRIKGRFTDSKGTILYDPADPTRSSITIVIDAKTLDTGWPHRDEHLRTSDFFDVEKYPTITFQSQRILRTSNGWRADGNLTMHGVTKPISIPFKVLRGEPTRSPESHWMIMNIEGGLKLARADFGIFGGSQFNSWFDKARQATMADSVEINLEIEGYRTDAQSFRSAGIDQALERIKIGGIQAQIDRLKSLLSAGTASEAGVINGGDFVTRALIAGNQTKDAVTLSRAISEMFPSNARAHNLYGVALAAAGDNRNALAEYSKAKQVFKAPVRDPNEKFPQVDDTWYYQDNLVRTLLEWNKASIAVSLARTLAELYPDNARAHDTLGLALASAGDKPAAATAYARALSLDPRETRAMEHQRRLN